MHLWIVTAMDASQPYREIKWRIVAKTVEKAVEGFRIGHPAFQFTIKEVTRYPEIDQVYQA